MRGWVSAIPLDSRRFYNLIRVCSSEGKDIYKGPILSAGNQAPNCIAKRIIKGGGVGGSTFLSLE